MVVGAAVALCDLVECVLILEATGAWWLDETANTVVPVPIVTINATILNANRDLLEIFFIFFLACRDNVLGTPGQTNRLVEPDLLVWGGDSHHSPRYLSNQPVHLFQASHAACGS